MFIEGTIEELLKHNCAQAIKGGYSKWLLGVQPMLFQMFETDSCADV